METSDGLFWAAITAVPLAISGAVSWGYVKGKLHNFVDFGTHRQMCHEKSQETNETLREMRDDIKQLIAGQADLSGYIRGQQNGKC